MSLKTVEGIERALVTLTPHQLGELYAWFDPYRHPLYARIESDLASGRLDQLMQGALSDERHGRAGALQGDESPRHVWVWKAHGDLGADIQLRANKQFALLRENAHHPSLNLKKVGDRNGMELWSVRVTLNF